ncbi:MAG: 5'/3'-nucleotidase SurE [Brevinemataceae bacterium]
MKILFTNDDGYDAIGIQTLYREFSSTSKYDTFMCAPLRHKSAFSHAINYYDHLELVDLKKMNIQGFALDSTPADCVRSGLGGLFDTKFDLVLSGINYGVNAAQDIFYSGTIGAAREATFHGIMAVASSLDIQMHEQDFEHKIDNNIEQVFQYAAKIMQRIVDSFPKEILQYRGSVININFPQLVPAKGIKLTSVGDHRYSVKLEHKKSKESHYVRIASVRDQLVSAEGSDVHHLEEGYIVVTALHRGVVIDDILQSKLHFLEKVSIDND